MIKHGPENSWPRGWAAKTECDGCGRILDRLPSGDWPVCGCKLPYCRVRGIDIPADKARPGTAGPGGPEEQNKMSETWSAANMRSDEDPYIAKELEGGGWQVVYPGDEFAPDEPMPNSLKQSKEEAEILADQLNTAWRRGGADW